MAFRETRLWTDAEDKRVLRMYREGYEPRTISESLVRPVRTVSELKRRLLEEECPTN